MRRFPSGAFAADLMLAAKETGMSKLLENRVALVTATIAMFATGPLRRAIGHAHDAESE